ncbi:putative transcription factor C2C2-CO-like family [Helianthus debilis subsp. tardiflorus]
MSSTILTGGTGRAYGFDIENVVKSPSMTSSRNSHSSSPSSTLSESSNSPIAISNRKPRTPRKRPNQTYNEAAEIEEGIDSIMGSSNSTIETRELNNDSCLNFKPNTCYGYPLGLGFGGNLEFNFGMGMRNGIRALKNGDDGNWWNFPTVNVADVSPRVAVVAQVKVKKSPMEKKKKKKRVEELMKRSESELELEFEQGNKNNGDGNGCKLLLKLNYDDVLNAWSDKGSPLPEEISGSESADGDIHTRLAQIDLFSESGGLREASVMRYKEKKRTRLFSKKIRYQVRKVNADRRPRSKGRFVRRSNSEDT